MSKVIELLRAELKRVVAIDPNHEMALDLVYAIKLLEYDAIVRNDL